VVDDQMHGDSALQEECLKGFTIPSLAPLPYRIVSPADIDASLNRAAWDDVEHVVLLSSGTLITDLPRFFVELFASIAEMRTNGEIVRGHLTDWYRNANARPEPHEQFALINVRQWKQLGRPPLRRSDTPWGTLPRSLQSTKRYAYPLAPDGSELANTRAEIANILNGARDQVFYFNNERLNIISLAGFKPAQFITLAAGLKPAAILNQYWPDRTPERIDVLDYSENALNYVRGLCANRTSQASLRSYIDAAVGHDTDKLLEAQIREAFNSDFSLLARALDILSQADFTHADFISNHEHILARLDRSRPFVMWHSNAWACDPIKYCMSQLEIADNYRTLVLTVRERLGLRAWKLSGSLTVILGDSPETPFGLITDGYTDVKALEFHADPLDPDLYIELMPGK
jgi:hypothetical protein